jgi:lysophospholipase L1-like esterase
MRTIIKILLFGLIVLGGSLGAEAFNCATPVKIMPLGDSITQGVENGSDSWTTDSMVGYRQDLYLSLIKRYNIHFVGTLSNGTASPFQFDTYHDGWAGFSAVIQNYLNDWGSLYNGPKNSINNGVSQWLAQTRPDIVLLHIGTNDLDFDERPADIANDVGMVLDKIRSYNPDVLVILARIINRVPGATHIQDTTDYNSYLQAMVSNRPDAAKIRIVDMESALNYSTDMSNELHPNDLGYSKMANVWFNALTNSTTPILPVCAPAGPVLTFPLNSLAVTGTTVTFAWQKSTGPNGDAVSYDLYYGTSGDFNGTSPVKIMASANSSRALAQKAGAGSALLLFFTAVFIGGPRKRKKIIFFAAALLLMIALVSCGGGGGGSPSAPSGSTPSGNTPSGDTNTPSGNTPSGNTNTPSTNTPPSNSMTWTTNLSPNTTYYWKVVAADPMGKIGESQTWVFSTGQ